MYFISIITNNNDVKMDITTEIHFNHSKLKCSANPNATLAAQYARTPLLVLGNLIFGIILKLNG